MCCRAAPRHGNAVSLKYPAAILFVNLFFPECGGSLHGTSDTENKKNFYQ
jgi:hypothetical protein